MVDDKMKGVTWKSVYDVKKPDYEYNDGESETITTGYIPINEQVKMVMRGQITIGSWTYDDFPDKDEDLEKIPEDHFEDATDFATPYEDDFAQAVSSAIQKGTGNTSEQQSKEITTQRSETSEANAAQQVSQASQADES